MLYYYCTSILLLIYDYYSTITTPIIMRYTLPEEEGGRLYFRQALAPRYAPSTPDFRSCGNKRSVFPRPRGLWANSYGMATFEYARPPKIN